MADSKLAAKVLFGTAALAAAGFAAVTAAVVQGKTRRFDRLQQVVERTLRERLNRVVIESRDEHEVGTASDVCRGVHAGQARHVHVEEADIRLALVEQGDRLAAVPGLRDDLELGPHDRELAA